MAFRTATGTMPRSTISVKIALWFLVDSEVASKIKACIANFCVAKVPWVAEHSAALATSTRTEMTPRSTARACSGSSNINAWSSTVDQYLQHGRLWVAETRYTMAVECHSFHTNTVAIKKPRAKIASDQIA